MASEVLLGFTIRLMYTNDMFLCIYDLLGTEIGRRLDEQMFLYVFLAAITLLPESELHIGGQ